MEKLVTIRATKLGGGYNQQTFEYEAGDWKILSIEGLDSPPIELFHTPKGQGDGDIRTGYRIHPRLITIKAKLANFTNYAEQRILVTRFHDVRARYRLAITYLDRTVITNICEISAISYPTENILKSPVLTVAFLAYEPGLYGSEEKTIGFAQVHPMWHVTREYSFSNGALPFSYIDSTNKVDVEYNGTDEVGFKMDITLSANAPRVVVAVNGGFFTILEKSSTYPLTAGAKIEIDTQNKTASYNGVKFIPSALRQIHFDYLKLVPGLNTVQVVQSQYGDTTPVNASINLKYRERFLSI